MAAKLSKRIKVEFYFLNGAGKEWVLDPAVDKIIESHPKRITIIRKSPPQTIHLSREYIAYYTATTVMVDLEEQASKLREMVEASVANQDVEFLKH